MHVIVSKAVTSRGGVSSRKLSMHVAKIVLKFFFKTVIRNRAISGWGSGDQNKTKKKQKQYW